VKTIEKVVRQLGAYEAIFTRAQRGNFVMVASFAGTATVQVWEASIAALVARHPMLRVNSEEKDGSFAFLPAERGNVRLMHRKRGEGEDWRATVGGWLAGRMGIDSRELARVLVLEGDDSCDVLLGMHHALGDGRSALGLLEDLMRAVDGLDLSPYSMPSDVDHLLEQRLGPLPDLANTQPLWQNWHTSFLPYDQPWAPLEAASLTFEETESLARRARAEGTTVTGALAAALVNGWRRVTSERQNRPVRLMMPVDVRSRVGLGKELMLAISTTNQMLLPEQSEDFWKLAHAMRVAANTALEKDVLLGTAAGRAAGIRGTSNKQQLDEFTEQHLAWDLLVSNLGRWEPSYQGRTLRLTDVWGPAALYGFNGERGLGAVTVGGELRLLLASRVAAPGLLEAIRHELREAVR
jgi:hypothetical protein